MSSAILVGTLSSNLSIQLNYIDDDEKRLVFSVRHVYSSPLCRSKLELYKSCRNVCQPLQHRHHAIDFLHASVALALDGTLSASQPLHRYSIVENQFQLALSLSLPLSLSIRRRRVDDTIIHAPYRLQQLQPVNPLRALSRIILEPTSSVLDRLKTY